MAEEKNSFRDFNAQQMLPWTELFRGFKVAIDPRKLLLAVAGIVVMSFGWWLLALIFAPGAEPPSRDNPRYAVDRDKISDDEARQHVAADASQDRIDSWKQEEAK